MTADRTHARSDDAPGDDTLPGSVTRRRLAPAVVLVVGIGWARRGGLPALVLLLGRPLVFVLAVLAVALAVAVPALVLTWQRWTYAVADDRLEVRRGILNRSVRVVRLDRVRGVEVNAPLIPRLLGLVEVQIEVAAGGPGGAEVRLPAVRRDEGERLRAVLLDRAPLVGPDGASPSAAVASGERILHRTRTGLLLAGGATSLRYVVAPLALGFALLETVDDLGAVDPRDLAESVDGVAPGALGVLAIVVLLTVVLVGLGALGQLLTDRGFTLTDRPTEGRLVSERGLLTRRVVGLDRARVRGVDVVDGLLRRPFRLLSVAAIIAGATGGEPGRTSLVPVAPAEEAWAVAGAVLGPLPDPDAVRRHPVAALPRRLVRAVGVPAVLAVVAGVLGAEVIAAGAAAVTVAGVPLAYDRWCHLGHATDGTWLVVHEGSVVRRRTVVAADAIVALRIVSTPTQRRAGLCTLYADLGTGAGSRRALDLATDDAERVVRALAPDLTRTL